MIIPSSVSPMFFFFNLFFFHETLRECIYSRIAKLFFSQTIKVNCGHARQARFSMNNKITFQPILHLALNYLMALNHLEYG